MEKQEATPWDARKVKTILTETEVEILRLVQEGKSSSQIARLRNCSPRTVERHRSNMVKKLELAPSQNALLLWLMENGYLLNT
ncbi:MAG TPA: helix-turn-helix transcriptional regulator [Flavobacteriaceae bacterium]|nr:helix-turn-helix transcriptional regulator [Flavobacteriaceae bacterium]MCB9212743.1 helix-turn-helix transcriptional regulator [Alteromonas sp.]HPF11742.1 helix-turn-helix transcriptional regulator [Flavobacteriaceae bacterium]HQU20768.1 helix-turn-helix transcriptional regulator [Flavobacteriaceae bacterium]HQU64943.1 helix-turn-helix transcriptional regulator [Flavobacteriaceae bacterium]